MVCDLSQPLLHQCRAALIFFPLLPSISFQVAVSAIPSEARQSKGKQGRRNKQANLRQGHALTSASTSTPRWLQPTDHLKPQPGLISACLPTCLPAYLSIRCYASQAKPTFASSAQVSSASLSASQPANQPTSPPFLREPVRHPVSAKRGLRVAWPSIRSSSCYLASPGAISTLQQRTGHAIQCNERISTRRRRGIPGQDIGP